MSPATAGSSSAEETVELCAGAGVVLDPWQRLVLEHGMAERPGSKGRWAAFEVGFVVPRQNGKGEILLARELAGLFLFGERTITHSAHEFKTCREHFRRILAVIRNCPKMWAKVANVSRAHGEESIELKSGARLLFMARTGGSGRGFSGDLVVLDEAQILSSEPIEAMIPTLSTMPNPQVWYAGTAGTHRSEHLGSVRRRALDGGTARLAYLEWSADDEAGFDPADPAVWRATNPALGIRISEEYVADERDMMSPDGFARERLGVGSWPADDGFQVIPAAVWRLCADPRGDRPGSPVVFAVDVNPERSAAAVAVAGRRPDGLLAVEVADHPLRLDRVVDRMAELDAKWHPVGVAVDAGGPAGTLVGPLEAAGVHVLPVGLSDVARAAEGFYDTVVAGQVRHPGDARLDAAVAGAKTRDMPSGSWAWARRTSAVDISPLVAASFALWGYQAECAGAEPNVYF